MGSFTTATLLPAVLIGAGVTWGGVWIVFALLVMTLVIAAMDELSRRAVDTPSDTVPTGADFGAEFPAGTALAATLGGVHFVLLGAVIWRVGADDALVIAEKVGLFFAAGLFFGQISNSNAHELIHRRSRALRRLGAWIYISLFFGHHASAHPLVHHVRVATRDDPASARPGEGFYRFVIRAWIGGFREGLRAETRRRRAAGRPAWRHPYVLYIAGAAGLAALSLALAGPAGLVTHGLLAVYAQLQLMMSDYVQHYGLTRGRDAAGRPGPVGPEHSWNCPHRASAAMMLNAPRHSDHHLRPQTPYPALRADRAMPMLPRSLPVMCCVALAPPLWRRLMDPQVAAWRAAHPDSVAAG